MDNGRWITTENGVHVFIKNGQTIEDAFDSLDKDNGVDKPGRKYGTYYIYNDEEQKWASSYRKKDYEKLIASGRKGYFRDNETDVSPWERIDIPDSIEENMIEALFDINSAENFDDFERQIIDKLGLKIRDKGDAILDAFSDEIEARYREIIQPKIDRINSINSSNCSEIFKSGMKGYYGDQLSDDFIKRTSDVFNAAQDDDCKTIFACMVAEGGITFTDNMKHHPAYGSIGTCYIPSEKVINMLEGDNNTKDLFHEGFHSVYHSYNVSKSGLVEIMKEESKNARKVLREMIGLDAYIKEHAPQYLDKYLNHKKLLNEYAKVRWIMNHSTVTEEWNAAKDRYHKILSEMREFKFSYDTYKDLAKDEFRFAYPDLSDMAEAAGFEFGFGHGSSYWKDNETHQSNEFFAEMSSLKAKNKTDEYELIRKVFPKSVEKYEEIFNNIKNNKGGFLDI